MHGEGRWIRVAGAVALGKLVLALLLLLAGGLAGGAAVRAAERG